MKNIFIIALACLLSPAIQSQSVITGQSPVTHLQAGNPANAKTYQAYPEMVLKNDRFSDINGDQAINAFEQDTISFEIENLGTGTARNVEANISLKGAEISGLTYSKKLRLGTILPDQTKKAIIPITASGELKNGLVTFIIYVKEDNFDAKHHEITIETREFRAPNIIVKDAEFTMDREGKIGKGDKVTLTALIQNTGTGHAEDVAVSFAFTTKNINALERNKVTIDTLKAGESKALTFRFMTRYDYESDEIPIQVKITEKYRKYAEGKLVTALINQEVTDEGSTRIISKPVPDVTMTGITSLTSDVDKNIPRNKPNPNLYGLVIGNEDYTSYQPTLSSEADVKYAKNDARIFKEYLIKTLGASEKNVEYLTNATSSQISKFISKLEDIAEIKEGKAEIVFYYSGHGYPDEITKDAYLIPVDVSAADLSDAIKLNSIYKRLTNHPTQRVLVFLDACFSGKGKSGGLLALKSVAFKPNDATLKGNLVALSSSSGVESSGIYQQEKHGLFTYFLLKKIKETKGEITLKELSDYLKKEVALESVVVNDKKQTPQVLFSTDVEGKWEKWRLVE